MAIEFNCRACGKLLRTTDENAGRRARCPDCGEPFVVPAAAAPETYGIQFDSAEPFTTSTTDPAAVPPRPTLKSSQSTPAPASAPAPSPSPSVEEMLRPCPMCGTQVDRQTTRCPSCGEELRMDFSAGSQFASGNVIALDRVYRQAWQAFTSQMGASILGGFLLTLAFLVPTVLLYLLVLAFDDGGSRFSFDDEFGYGSSFPVFIRTGIALAFLSLGLMLLHLLWGTQIWLGGSRYFLNLVRRQHAHTGQILDSNQYRRALGNGTVLLLLISAICVVAGIFLQIFGVGGPSGYEYNQYDPWSPAAVRSSETDWVWNLAMSLIALLAFIPFSSMYFVLADQDAPRMMCLRLSREASKGNYFSLLLIFLSLIALNVLGALALLIGLLFTIPLGFLILAAAYDQMTTTHSGDVA